MSAFIAALVAEDLDTIPNRTLYTPKDEEAWLAKAAAGRAFFLLAFDGPEIVGLLDLWAGETRGARHVVRFGMSVARDWRGRGLGRRLLERALEEVRAWPDVCRIELEVVPWNTPAVRLYESLGFTVEARKAKAIDLRGSPEDLLLMSRVW